MCQPEIGKIVSQSSNIRDGSDIHHINHGTELKPYLKMLISMDSRIRARVLVILNRNFYYFIKEIIQVTINNFNII